MDTFMASINEAAEVDETPTTPQNTRRSGRSRKANTKYANVGWTKETLRALRQSSESSGPTSVDTDEESLNHDDNFVELDLQIAAPEASEDEDIESDASQSTKSTKSSHIATPKENNDANHQADDDVVVEADVEANAKADGESFIRRGKFRQPAHLHSRGLTLVERGRSIRGGAWQAFLGPKLEDLSPMLKSKEIWLYNVRDVTLPSRKSIRLCSNEWAENEKKECARTINNEIPPAIKQCQRLSQISLEEARQKLLFVNGPDQKILLGPWSQQNSYDLPFLQSIGLGQAWVKNDEEPVSSYHSGWLLNVGEKPRCMAWSAYESGEQYLALTCRSTPEQREAVPNSSAKAPPAFSPSTGYPTSVQIWRFAIADQNDDKSSMDYTTAPRFIQCIGLHFGDVKQMRWLPGAAPTKERSHLGTLMLLTSDGCGRLVQIPYYDRHSAEPIFLDVVSSFIQVNPPKGSVYTCFTFASPIDLILGTSKGCIDIYNIAQSPHDAAPPTPYLNLQIDSTYLMSLTVADGDYSHFLVSASATGDIQLTDLRSPMQDQVHLPKARIPCRDMVYNAQCRAFVMTVDNTGNTEPRGNAQTGVIAHTLRHFYTGSLIARYPEGAGTSTALGGSPLHPFVLMGNSSGTIWTQNVLRRILPTGKSGAKTEGGSWVQKLVEYEWMPQPPGSTDAPTTNSALPLPQNQPDLYHGPPIRPGISRLHLGFIPEKLDLSNVGSKKRKVAASGLDEEGAVLVTYEEEQAVAVVEWNPNPVAAGWAAIAWGSGVVLVTDLGHDATE